MSKQNKRTRHAFSARERETAKQTIELSSGKVFKTNHMTELNSYYNLCKSRIRQEKLENERKQAEAKSRALEKTNRGIDAIFEMFPKDEKFVSFIKDAIDSGITRVKLCSVTCAEFEYRNLLNSASMYITSRVPSNTRVYLSRRDSGCLFNDSIALIWDWSEMFLSLYDSEDQNNNNNNEDDDYDPESVFGTFDFCVANSKFLARHGLKCLEQEDLQEFV